MKKYITNRLLQTIVVLIGVTLLTFLMVNIAPGSAAAVMTEKITDQAAIDRINAQLGLDKPLYMQYLLFLKNMFVGDFGQSFFKHKPVTTLLLDGFRVTGMLAIFVLIFAVIIGVTLGILAALNRGKVIDQFIMSISTLGMALPSFLLAIGLQWTFGLKLKVLPLSGMDSWESFILPTMTLSTLFSAEVARLTRTNMLDVLDQDYIRTAKAKGMGRNIVIFSHALKNALIPILTYLGTSIKEILGGSVLIEIVFSLNGIGSLLVDSIMQRDTPVIQGVTVYIAIIFVIINLLIDLIYGVIDPRIRLSNSNK